MRNLIALFACSFVVLHASASDAPAAKKPADTAKLAAELAKPAASVPAPKAAAKHGAEPSDAVKAALEKAALDKPARANAATADAAAAAASGSAPASARSEEDAQVALSIKIAERLAEMRAKQAARAAAAAKAKRVREARRKQEVQLAAAPKISHHWDYEGEFGPENWGKINPAWAQCGSGKRQSPIDIRDGMPVGLEEIDFDYRPSAFSEIDNGHTVQVNLKGANAIVAAGERYELVQFHFHRPSEERIDGRGTEMVVHLVHRSAGGKLAVVAVLLERGKANPVIDTAWSHIPLEKGVLANPDAEIDPYELLPQRREYYTYMGSLTTPPCTENVLWLVMKQPMTASPAQMALFSRLYPLNARPVQASEGRMIKQSN